MMKQLIISPKTEYADVEVVREEDLVTIGDVGNIACVRSAGEFNGKGLFLAMGYDYHIGKDSQGATLLIPTKKRGRKTA